MLELTLVQLISLLFREQKFMPAPGVTTEVLLRVIDITIADAGTYTCTANIFII